ncbi:MAG: potassium-transporting ATPase subunit KdpA [Pseudomonas sp. PGPPP4]|uniref:potassium-transporting ATPase subunit KdpA n=1 Tax=Pseudomonas TaxID=286 RepID=UPI000BD0585A|nr:MULTISPECIES: potassium-transporting ATPase subunit KdpA [Pseudomonas]MCI1012002.1 potassium-transporting ATPase subunit KdpA [Pseudomonas oryzihabitans]OYT85426.1 MAG: potassium-transporting ATPase subunit KdpA [Pseudomonas sp. PGPPP4]
MDSQAAFLILAFLALTFLPAPFLGRYFYRALEGERTWLTFVGEPLERLTLKVVGTDGRGQDWRTYAIALVLFNGLGIGLLFAILLLQGELPLNPQHLPGLEWTLALNTAISFVTNTNWQAYSGEASLSYFSQMVGLGVQNFVSAAVGVAVLAALARGITRRSAQEIGNFWVDLFRATFYVLLPLCVPLALLLIWQGVPQTFAAYVDATTLQGASQTLPLGPAASQIAIKQLGTNGGGFFGVNSAHPFENPTALSDLLELSAILMIPAALVFSFGHYVKDRRQSWAIFAAMFGLLVIGGAVAIGAQNHANPALAGLSITQGASLEGVETRFGGTASALWATVTTAASNGSVNAMHDSLAPLTGLIALFNMMLGEVIFGGVGAGLYGMLLNVLIAVFIAGLMVGRTPEYLGKKLEAPEVRLLVATLLVMPLGVLVLGAIAASVPAGVAGIGATGPHGFSQLLYAYTSATANNGSAFGGFSANTPFHNLMLSLALLIGRFGYILPILAIAGSLAAKRPVPLGPNSFPTHGPLFVTLLVITLLLVGGLTFLPTLALGPIADHLQLFGVR